MTKQKLRYTDLDMVKILEDGETLAWIGYILNEASPVLDETLQHLSLPQKRSDFISPCLVDLSGVAVDSVDGNLKNQGMITLDLREHVSLIVSLGEGTLESKKGVLLYAGEFDQFYNTDAYHALMFKFSSVYPVTKSSFWFSMLAFAKHQNYFLMEDYEKWYMTCKHIKEY